MLFPIKLAIRVVSLLLAAIVIYVAVTGVQVWTTSHQRSTASADAILALGSAEYNGTPSPDLRARLDEALSLFHEGRAPVVAVTGGKLAGDRFTEAGVSAAYLVAHGVPASVIVVGGGADTYENVSSVAPGLKGRGVKTLLVVTDPFHEDRAMAIASTFGFEPMPDPTPTSPITGWRTLPYFLKETVAVAAGRIVGYGALSTASHPGT
jgi:uncharacterized SAM-binding protein YcdF (DUF218 family)